MVIRLITNTFYIYTCKNTVTASAHRSTCFYNSTNVTNNPFCLGFFHWQAIQALTSLSPVLADLTAVAIHAFTSYFLVHADLTAVAIHASIFPFLVLAESSRIAIYAMLFNPVMFTFFFLLDYSFNVFNKLFCFSFVSSMTRLTLLLVLEEPEAAFGLTILLTQLNTTTNKWSSQ